jgi:uncharacterized SAM-binding protein YcdF (DUF218 family)
MTRIVAVLGFSDGTTYGLHPVCAARLERAAREARPDDVVLFSGWARGRAPAAEADLMVSSWSTPVRARVVDRSARTTFGNSLAAGRLARRIGADEILLVTSDWHGRRASALLRAALGRSRTTVRLATCPQGASRMRTLRELASWAALPLLALAARTR